MDNVDGGLKRIKIKLSLERGTDRFSQADPLLRSLLDSRVRGRVVVVKRSGVGTGDYSIDSVHLSRRIMGCQFRSADVVVLLGHKSQTVKIQHLHFN